MSGIFNPAIFNPAIFNTGDESAPTGFIPRDSSASLASPDVASATVLVPERPSAVVVVPTVSGEVE